jgi:probable F420-dependent oxidoreductase
VISRLGVAPLTGSFADDYGVLDAAEAAGFDSAWTNDGNVNGYVRLAAYAARTKRLKLGTGAAIQPLRNPIVHAAAGRDLAEMSEGRTILGMGSGVKPQLNRFYGIYGDQAEHAAPRMREFVQLLKILLGGGQSDNPNYQGRFFQLNVGRSKPSKYPVPVYVAAVNKHMLNVTAELADGIIGHPIVNMEYLTGTIVPMLNEGLAKHGRSRKDFDISAYILTSINEDRALARRDVAISLGFYLSPQAFNCIYDAAGWDEEKRTTRDAFRTGNLENVAAAVTDRMVDSCCLYGTEDEVREGLKRYEGIVDQAILYSPGHSVPRERQYDNFHRIIKAFGK